MMQKKEDEELGGSGGSGIKQREPDWIRKQIKTFRAWCNHFLKERDMKISDFTTDLSDGVLMAHLLELLSGKKLRNASFNSNAKMKLHKIQNLMISFNFIETQHIVIVNIGPEDIYDGDIKLILGLIWTLILRFHIQKGEFDDEGRRKADAAEPEPGKKVSVKKQLLDWCTSVLGPQNINVNTFQECWVDGLAFCGLINAVEAGTIDVSALNPDDKRANLELAFNCAQKKLGIPKILDVDDMLEGKPDELSVMTYVSYFKQELTLHSGAKPAPKKCVASGGGLSMSFVGEKASFVISTKTEDGKECRKGGANVTAFLYDLVNTEKQIPLNVIDQDNGSYIVDFTPETEGEYSLQLRIDGMDIIGSPFNYKVKSPRAAAETSVVIPTSPRKSEKAEFLFQARDKFGRNYLTGGNVVEASIKIKCQVRDNEDGTYSISYDPMAAISDEQENVFLDVKLDGNTVGAGHIPVMLDLASHNQELEETMQLLQKAKKEREMIEKTREQLSLKIEEEVKRTKEVTHEMLALKELMEKEKSAKEELEMQKEKVEKELQTVSTKAKEQKIEDEKRQQLLETEIKGLQRDLDKEKKQRKSMESLKVLLEEAKEQLEVKVNHLETKLQEEVKAKDSEVEARKKVEEFAERLKKDFEGVSEKYEHSVEMLKEYEESQISYKERIEVLQERLESEENIKQNLENLQKRLGEEMGERKLLQQQLESELEKTKKLLESKKTLKVKNKAEEEKLLEKIKVLESKVSHEAEEKIKLESAKYKLERESSKRRQSRVLLQEEVDVMKFKLQVDSEALMLEKQQRHKLEVELEQLKTELVEEREKNEVMKVELNSTIEHRKELEVITEKLKESMQIMEEKFSATEKNAEVIQAKLEETTRERDDLQGLQVKLRGELRKRSLSRVFLDNQLVELRKALEEEAKRAKEQEELEKQREEEIKLLQVKLEAEATARVELEELQQKLEEELESERSNMLPSNRLDELEQTFHKSKLQVEVELAAKQNALDVTMKEDEEHLVRVDIEHQLAALQQKAKELEAKPLPVIKDTQASLARKKEKLKTRKRSVHHAKDVKEGRSSEKSSPSSSPSSGWLQKRKPSEERIEYKPKLDDPIDTKMAEAMAELDMPLPLQYVKPGVYQLAGKNINVRVLNGYLVIRVGGGYMKFNEWVDQYGKKYGIQVNTETLKVGSAGQATRSVGVHVRRGGEVLMKENAHNTNPAITESKHTQQNL